MFRCCGSRRDLFRNALIRSSRASTDSTSSTNVTGSSSASAVSSTSACFFSSRTALIVRVRNGPRYSATPLRNARKERTLQENIFRPQSPLCKHLLRWSWSSQQAACFCYARNVKRHRLTTR
uniref:Uncharacterized protein n=1 Tax=Anopheles albimanus TaxID=7167 RepID=A0A182FBY8_ANOAL